MPWRVLMVDDHLLFREAMVQSLAADPDIEVVAQAADGLAALQAVSHSQPDVVCLDVNMPGQSGIDITRQLLALKPDVRVIGVSAHADPLVVAQMLHAGAMGYVTKLHVGQELPQAIRQVGSNQTYLSPELDGRVAAEMLRLACDPWIPDRGRE